jgi:large subunit ribosomal protein L29
MATKQEIQNMDVSGLSQQLKDLRDEQFNLRFQHSTGQLENTARMKQVRREIARVKTIMKQKHEAAE